MVDTNIPCCLELLVNNSVLLGEPVDTIVRLSHPPDGSTDGVCLISHGHTSGGLVNLGDVDLDAGVVLGGQDTVAGGTLSEIFHNLARFLYFWGDFLTRNSLQ